jgi:hypothetical protein
MSTIGNKQLGLTPTAEAHERAIAEALEGTLRRYNDHVGPITDDRRTHDFVFHMTDWRSDLLALAALMRDPNAKTDEEWSQVVFAFLSHATGHIIAASKIMELDPVAFELPSEPKPAAKPVGAAATRENR